MLYRDSPNLNIFLEEICASLRERASCATIVAPRRYHEDLSLAFRKYAENFLNLVYTVDVTGGESLLGALIPRFCEGDSPPSLTSLFDLPTRDGATLLVKYPPENFSGEFLTFAEEAASRSRTAATTNQPLLWSMVFIVPPDADFPAEDAGFARFYWWGKRYQSDLEYIIEREIIPRDYGNPASRWFYALCKGVCEGAPELVPNLLAKEPAGLDDIVDVLRSSPVYNEENRRIALDYLEKYSPPHTRTALPQDFAAEAWAAGILDIGCQGQPRLHPAALLAARGAEYVEKLVVRGQCQVYIPMVPEATRVITESAERKLGPDWNRGIEEETLEIGGLHYHLNNTLSGWSRGLREEIELAKYWRELRNELAHYKMIEARLALFAVAKLDEFKRGQAGKDA